MADRKEVEGFPFHMAGEKYLSAVTEAVQGVPVVIPALSEGLNVSDVVARCDGILLTGSLSNVGPERYAGKPSRPGTLHDRERDAAALPLIEATIASKVPLLAICRGFQEVNVALGGTLHQHIGEMKGHLNHQADGNLPIAQRYAPLHDISITPEGRLHGIAGASTARVNSLHEQGVDALAPGLTVEARAPDGVIEAFTISGADGFNLAVQWHPEFEPLNDALSTAIFAAFGDACRQR